MKNKAIRIKKVLKEFNEWIELNCIRNIWTHEDYDDVTVYESRSADIICIQRDKYENVIDAWME